jgi:anti-sigma factor ChrR (cupin superfamily)
LNRKNEGVLKTAHEEMMVGNTPNLSGQELLAELSSRYVHIDDLPWEPSGGPGIERKVLLEDKERGMLTALIRWSPGSKLPMHEHLDFEQSFVLEGSLCDHEGECKAGDYVWRPPGSSHRAWSPDGCLLLAIFLAPNKFLEGPKAKPDDKNK